jgi:hypothetical protein
VQARPQARDRVQAVHVVRKLPLQEAPRVGAGGPQHAKVGEGGDEGAFHVAAVHVRRWILAQSRAMQPTRDTPPETTGLPVSPATAPPEAERRPVEIGGPQGPEPTRYGDWERKGRCIDF